ncbi:unnamed protein product [Symbiodinium natans]|uniref:Uncharacterized protein n=1 Tax=Symbiodinium natans TaxID=878477 RepID=A0A812UPL7_9DINO|nr:unnamed protein product [Symbiodinium natans]
MPYSGQEAAEEALQEARNRQDQVMEAAALQTLVAVHLAQKAVPAAVRYAQEAAVALEALEDRVAEAGAWHLAAQLHMSKDALNASEALRCAQAARAAHKGCEVSANEEATVLQTLSAAHLANGEAAKALEVASAGRELCKQALLRCFAFAIRGQQNLHKNFACSRRADFLRRVLSSEQRSRGFV